MTPVLKLDASLWWDLGAMTTVDMRARIIAGVAFVVDVDPEACLRLWGHRWSSVVCQPVTIANVPAWAVSAALAALPTAPAFPLVGIATAAAPAVGRVADDGAVGATPYSYSCPSLSSFSLQSSSLTSCTAVAPASVVGRGLGAAVDVVALGISQHFASQEVTK